MAHRVDIDDFLPFALVHAPNCSDLIAYRYIREASRELCERCKVWRETDEMLITEDTCETLSTIPDADIVSIENAALDGVPLKPVTLAWLDENHPGWDRSEERGGARYITQTEPNTVQLYPRTAGNLTMRIVLQPSLTAMTMPGILLTKWGNVIGEGAAASILLLPNDDGGGDPAKAAALLGEFRQRIVTARFKAAKGQQGAPLRTKGSYF